MLSLRVANDTAKHLRFTHRAWPGSVSFATGLLLAGLALRDSQGLMAVVIGSIGAVLAVVGAWRLLRRIDLDLNLAHGTYRLRRGVWPRPIRRAGLLRLDFAAVRLERHWHWHLLDWLSGSYAEHPVWRVILVARDGAWTLPVFEDDNEVMALREWDRRAEQLGLEAIDATHATDLTFMSEERQEMINGDTVGSPRNGAGPPSDLEVTEFAGGFTVHFPEAGLSDEARAIVIGGVFLIVTGAISLMTVPWLASILMAAGMVITVGAFLSRHIHECLTSMNGSIAQQRTIASHLLRQQLLELDAASRVRVRGSTGWWRRMLQQESDHRGLGPDGDGAAVFDDHRELLLEGTDCRLVCGRGQRDDHLEWIAARLRRELPATADN